MKLLIIRHGDPDYDRDCLTETGRIEARALADRMVNVPVDYYYCSPLGRAKDTAAPTLERLGREAEIFPWLQEFCPPYIIYPTTGKEHIVWDWLPQDWTSVPSFYDPDHWMEHPAFVKAGVGEAYDKVVSGFDALLARHGYERDGNIYRVKQDGRVTIALFCHFGLQAVLLSRLLRVSPMILWHGMVAAPTSVTTLYTEERREGIASFRMQSFGDLSHLYAKGLEPSFAARFCETWNSDERHD